jgi:hypothetical protein
MTPTTDDILRALKDVGPDYREAIVMPLEAVNALEAKYGRLRMVEHALASRDRMFRLAAALTTEWVIMIKVMDENERARQAGKKGAEDALSDRVTKSLTTTARRAVSNSVTARRSRGC